MNWRWLCLLVLMSGGCSSSGGASGHPDSRRQLLIDLTDGVILPTYRELPPVTTALAMAVESLCEKPDDAAAVESARQAWRDARGPWKRAEALRFGPATDLRIVAALDFWPPRPGDIDDELDQVTPIDDAYVGNLGVTRKGFPALEYLLFARADRLVEPRACAYAAAVARAIDERVEALLRAWEPEGGDFRGELILAGDGSGTYDALSMALNAVANALFGGLANIESMKLAKPLGKRDGGQPQPQAVESPYAHASLSDAGLALEGALAVYTASLGEGSGTSFSSAVRGLDPQLDAEVLATYERCNAALEAILPPLEEAVVSSPTEVEAAFACAKTLYNLHVVDVAGVLGLTPTFGDSDGD